MSTSRALLLLVILAGCSGSGSNVMMPAPNGAAAAGSGNVTLKIFVPAQSSGVRNPAAVPTPVVPLMGGNAQSFGSPGIPPAAPGSGPATPAPPGSQTLAISVNGPAVINQTITVGPNANGCAAISGGTTCQVSLSMPAGTYAGTIGSPNGSASTAVAFTVTPNGQNLFSLTTSGIPASVQIVPASPLAATVPQTGIDFYGAGRHPVVVEALDVNQNVIVGAPGNVSLSVSGGSLAVTVSQTPGAAANLFTISFGATASTAPAYLRATVNYVGTFNPCAQPAAVCNGSVRIDDRQILGIANANANDVSLYVNGQNAPLATIASGIAAPQALAFDALGNVFVADQPASVTEYAPPYTAAPATIVNGVNHPQALAIDARGNLFVANGSGSNTVTVYSPPYNGPPQTTISSAIDDPVDLVLDAASDLYVVNQAHNTVAIYAPPYAAPPTILSKGLNAPNSLALDGRGNLFVANLNSTPNSVVEYSPPFSAQSEPVVTISNGINEQGSIGLGASANLFVPNQGANTVTEYVAPYSKAPITIAGGQSQPIALAIDAAANLYVANLGNNSVTEYAAPYGSGSWTAITNGVSQPIALALSPASGSALSLVP